MRQTAAARNQRFVHGPHDVDVERGKEDHEAALRTDVMARLALVRPFSVLVSRSSWFPPFAFGHRHARPRITFLLQIHSSSCCLYRLPSPRAERVIFHVARQFFTSKMKQKKRKRTILSRSGPLFAAASSLSFFVPPHTWSSIVDFPSLVFVLGFTADSSGSA